MMFVARYTTQPHWGRWRYSATRRRAGGEEGRGGGEERGREEKEKGEGGGGEGGRVEGERSTKNTCQPFYLSS